ncbi:MAG: GAF domain-containing protein [Anaerolineae bacterium]|nr:GAF domain-containing protein [Anaerolineae bacterium]
MKAISLKKLLNRQELKTLLPDWSALHIPPITLGVADATGKWLAAHPSVPADETLLWQVCQTQNPASNQFATVLPLAVQETFYGIFYISPDISTIRDALQHVLIRLIEKELTQKSLAQETLDRYREVNLLYRVHETIGASLDLEEVLQRVLYESIRIIKANGGAVFLYDDLTNKLVPHKSAGADVATAEQLLIGQALSDKVMRTGRSRILNDLHTFVRLESGEGTPLSALLSAPFKSKETVLGVITLARTNAGTMFTAGDEKLLTALASQVGVAIANALTVRKREERFRQQIQALKIEIDEAKKQKEVAHITESDYFRHLQENAQRMRQEFDI